MFLYRRFPFLFQAPLILVPSNSLNVSQLARTHTLYKLRQMANENKNETQAAEVHTKKKGMRI